MFLCSVQSPLPKLRACNVISLPTNT